jgi:hypothetical protein
MSMTSAERADFVAATLRGYRFRFSSERDLQDGIGRALAAAGYVFEREVRLAPGDIVDFVASDVGIEVKIAGSPQAIARQLMRYAGAPRVGALVLVTRSLQHAHRFPAELAGKPLRVVTLETSAL